MRRPPVGQLRDRVTLQSPAFTRNSQGEDVLAWTDVATEWAEVRPGAGREVTLDRQINSANAYTIRIRFREDVVPSWRVVYRGRPLDVVAVTDVESRRRFLAITAVENRP